MKGFELLKTSIKMLGRSLGEGYSLRVLTVIGY